MTLGQLRRLTAHLPEDTLILARDRDSINLEMVDIVGPVPEGVKVEFIEDDWDSKFNPPAKVTDPQFRQSVPRRITFVEDISQVYGGRIFSEPGMTKPKTAVIFCDND
jgi:hypothetical protein